jgi:CMP-N-acetylneuraminic acid synthetase
VITALIPARGGSKRVPHKNVRLVGGKTLIDWAIELARKSPLIAMTIVSTDSDEIVSKSNLLAPFLEKFESSPMGSLVEIDSGFVIHKRELESSKDHSRTISIVEEIFRISDIISEELLLLQPTSPFRSTSEIAELIKLKLETNAASVFSVKKVESPHPSKCFELNEKSQISMSLNALNNLQTPELELPEFFAPDGAFYLVAREFLKKEKVFVNQDSVCFKRSGVGTINIDTELDLDFARFIAETNTSFL